MPSDATVLAGSSETESQVETSETENNEAEETAFTLDGVKRQYFEPSDLQDAQELVDQIVALDCRIHRNFDPAEEFPEGFGLGVIPISTREGSKNVVKSVAICAVPSTETVVSHEDGQDFIRGVLADAFMTKAASAFRPRPDGSVAASVPKSVQDFITSLRGKEGLKTFTEIAPPFVKALKQKGIKFMTPLLLRQTLQSAAFAAEQFAKINQEVWVKFLDRMIETAETKKLDPQILKHWKETRNEAAVIEANDDVVNDALEGL